MDIADKERYGDYTEAGTGKRLVAMFKDVLKWCRDTGNWYEYRGDTGLWSFVDESRLYHYVLKVAEEVKKDANERLVDVEVKNEDGEVVRTIKNKTNALNYARTMEKLSHCRAAIAFAKDSFLCLQGDFDKNPLYLGLPDCKVINLMTGEVEESKAEYMITLALAGTVKDSVSDKFITFINKFLENEELRNYFWRFCGCALLGQELRNTNDKMALFVDSVSGSGKSTFLKVLRSAMGDYFKFADIRLLTTEIKDPNKPNPLLCHLQGARIVGFSEIPAGTQFVSDVFKRLAAADVALTRNVFGKMFEYIPNFKLLVMANDLPRPDETDDDSFRCRFRRIKVEKPITEKDPDIERNAKTKEWRDDMVTWLVKGAQEYLKAGALDDYNGSNLDTCNLPQPIKDSIKQYVGDNDTMLDFFTANFIFDKDGKEPWQNIFNVYRDYTKDNRTTYYEFVRTYKKALSRFNLTVKRCWVKVPIGDDDDGVCTPKLLDCVMGIRPIKNTDTYESLEMVQKRKQIKVVNNTNVS